MVLVISLFFDLQTFDQIKYTEQSSIGMALGKSVNLFGISDVPKRKTFSWKIAFIVDDVMDGFS